MHELPSEVREMALAHAVGNKVEEAYRRGDLFQKRRFLMEAWSAFCERCPAPSLSIRNELTAMPTEEEHQKRREFWFLQAACRTIDNPYDPPGWPAVTEIYTNPEAARARIYAWYDATQRTEELTNKPEEKPHWIAAAEAFKWLEENGLPKPKDGKQHRLEDHIANTLVALVKPLPVKSTIREHARRFINEFKTRKGPKAD